MTLNIANNIRSLEIIKIEILQNVTNLFGNIISESDENLNNTIANDAANIITLIHILCKRLGIEYKTVNGKIKLKLEKSIEEQHNLEKRFGDLTYLLNSIKENEKL